MMMKLTAILLLAASASGFLSPASRPVSTAIFASSVTTSDETALTDSLKILLENLDGPDGGSKLLEASSPKWQSAIYAAVGAPETADRSVVAGALSAAMSRPDNQFALLMGTSSHKFVANFPSDPVMDEETAWVECRLRCANNDDLLVTMGISLVKHEAQWLIATLDWQDFRDEFYPGLSGREWLRSF